MTEYDGRARRDRALPGVYQITRRDEYTYVIHAQEEMSVALTLRAHRALWEWQARLALAFPADKRTIMVIFEKTDDPYALLRYITSVFNPKLRNLQLNNRTDRSFTLTAPHNDFTEDEMWYVAAIAMGLPGIEEAKVEPDPDAKTEAEAQVLKCFIWVPKSAEVSATGIHDLWRILAASEDLAIYATILKPSRRH